jgi:hypothetical protein
LMGPDLKDCHNERHIPRNVKDHKATATYRTQWAMVRRKSRWVIPASCMVQVVYMPNGKTMPQYDGHRNRESP